MFRDFSFTPFSVHGSIWNNDGEFWARKGIGRVRLEPAVNFTVEIFLSSLCAEDSNTYYRQIQATEFGEALRNSDADFVLGILSLVLPVDQTSPLYVADSSEELLRQQSYGIRAPIKNPFCV